MKRLFERFDPILATTARMEDLGINGGEGDEALAAVCNSGVTGRRFGALHGLCSL